uniref:Aldehyde oxidase/xanthine dehydrogenase a/b hammerhead domain-containing protein n=1 Tax=Chenopodium quinoa TaxID=63459 RepID=A0A803MH10_CHEQI
MYEQISLQGKATYVDDIPSPKDCLHGAFAYSTKPLASVNCVRYESESHPDRVVSVVSYKDIPYGGKNVGAQTIFGKDLLFADDLTRCAGERIALVVASACALAAYKLRHPVRMCLSRKTDMIMTGGRHPMKITYSVGFILNGKITALDLEILINAGISEDISLIMPASIVNRLKKYDWGALSLDIKLCKTNHTSKSAMRAPGVVQGTFIAEAVIEHVASTLWIDVDVAKDQNFHTFDNLTLF